METSLGSNATKFKINMSVQGRKLTVITEKYMYYNVIEIMINNSNKKVGYLNSIPIFQRSEFSFCLLYSKHNVGRNKEPGKE